MDSETRQKILDLVHSRPRAIAEIAYEINKNWRTADRYVEILNSEDLIKIHVFRKGGRGALKIAYWPTSITETPSAVKNFLFQKILNGRKKEDFSALDIIQHIPDKKREIYVMKKEYDNSKKNVDNFFKFIKEATSEILFFSGNLSFTQKGNRYKEILDVFEEKTKEGINIFILTRTEPQNEKIIKEILQLNKKGHKGKIEIRYAYQPLRCTIIDDKEARIKEEFSKYDESYKNKEEIHLYVIKDPDWIQWVIDVFWQIWRSSIEAEKRLKILDQTKKI